jgi:hypothetical protein
MTFKGDDRPRSLERRGMYSIFAPLDPNERLPRELLLDAPRQLGFSLVPNRWRALGRKEKAAAIALPALVLLLAAAGTARLDALETFGLAALFLIGLVAYAVSGRRSGGE